MRFMKKKYISPKSTQVRIEGTVSPVCNSAHVNNTPTPSWGNARERDYFEFNDYDWIFCDE